jgi:dTDP-4-amino-4,6-dideoxygalactose transaminase
MNGSSRLAVCRPLLPPQSRVAPYLRRMDSARWYSNCGPLNTEFEAKLRNEVGHGVITVANATVGISAALLGSLHNVDLTDRPLCIVPSWTFVATPHAAWAAGLTPYFADVDQASWQLTPEIAREAIRTAPGRVVAVVPVSPFGSGCDVDAWDRFIEETGVRVVVDAAAAFDTVKVGRCASVVSLHATKLPGIGEGGFVTSTDDNLLTRVRDVTNFGFRGNREARTLAYNCKLSETHAAYGLAVLDAWPEIRGQAMTVSKRMRMKLDPLGFRTFDGFGERWVSGTYVVKLPEGVDRDVFMRNMAERGIETRCWWGDGCADHPAFSKYPRTELETTARVAARSTGLPWSLDLTHRDIDRIVQACAEEAGHVRRAA